MQMLCFIVEVHLAIKLVRWLQENDLLNKPNLRLLQWAD